MEAAAKCVELAPTDSKYARAYFELARMQAATGDMQGASNTLTAGLIAHERYPDLNYLALMFQLQAFGNACRSSKYTGQPNVSMKFAGAVPQIARMLGLQMRGDGAKGGLSNG